MPGQVTGAPASRTPCCRSPKLVREIVRRVDGIPPVNGPRLPASQLPVSSLEFEYVRSLVRRESAIVLDDSKNYLVISRLLPLAKEHGFDSVGR